MSDFSALVLLLVLGATVGLWLKLSVARERAVRVARQQCRLHGLQLLDETVGLRALRLRRVDGLRRVERGYGFEVSIDGHDREPGRLWMIGDALTDLSLPVIEPSVAADTPDDGLASGKVVALRPRRVDRQH
ncbi:MAG: DUF3301 domain-containing protein [Rhodanobacter sp.]|jgi:hypothetical protein